MTLFAIIFGIVFSVWALLGVLGNERQRRIHQVEAEKAAEEARRRAAEAAKSLPGANLLSTHSRKAA